MSTIRLRFYIAAVVLLTIRPANTQDKSLRDDADVVVCDAFPCAISDAGRPRGRPL